VSRGRFFEKQVKDYLKQNNYNIISSNFYTPYGEIDLIAERNRKIYFIEVKYLSKDNIINPIKKIDMAKIRRIFLSISYLKKFCKILSYQVDSYSVYFKKGIITFECFPDLRLQ
jgi:Holliday junction resolvase-like predicted endonuclease